MNGCEDSKVGKVVFHVVNGREEGIYIIPESQAIGYQLGSHASPGNWHAAPGCFCICSNWQLTGESRAWS